MKFGQYELRELIAVGGMAEVYKGRVVGAEGFEKWVAIKRILPDLAEDERIVKMLLTEARIHSALSHRNIVQIHDLGISEDGEYFIVLEYVEGYDLRMITDQIAAQHEIIPEALSLHIASELAQGLHFAHELRGPDDQPLGLVHRDVSPSNVLISNAGEVKLSDFGLAKRRHDRSVVGSLKGSLAYMSPEQARQSTLDRRTDVFSLGAVLFELLTGKRLREITDEIVGWNEVASGHVPSVRAVRPDLPEAFERLLARALAPEPENRFADAASFGTAIRAVLVHMNTPVGSTDLQLLLSTLSPARRPRSLIPEHSKVIRLGPEARALGEAIAAPATPRPLAIPNLPNLPNPPNPPGLPGLTGLPTLSTLAPGMTPVAARPPGGVAGLPPPAGPARSLAEMAATPPPAGASSLPQPRREPSRGPTSLPRTEWPTPPGGFPPPRPGATARLHSLASAAAAPALASPSWGAGAAAAIAAPVVVERRPSTAEYLPTVAPAVSRTLAPAAAATLAPLTAPRLASAARPRHETARVVLRDGPSWRPLVLAAAAALLLAAAGVHFFFVPLEVLVVWRTPASLAVASDPPGAKARLDGRPIAELTPTHVTVTRDRLNHVLELSAPGYRPARQAVRFDESVKLAVAVRLEKEMGPTFEAMPAPTPGAPAPRVVAVAPARTDGKTLTKISRALPKKKGENGAKGAKAAKGTKLAHRANGTKHR